MALKVGLFPVELLVLKKVHSSSIIDINLICLCLVSCVCDKIDDLTISTSPSVLAPKLLKTSLLTYSFFMMLLPSILQKINPLKANQYWDIEERNRVILTAWKIA